MAAFGATGEVVGGWWRDEGSDGGREGEVFREWGRIWEGVSAGGAAVEAKHVHAPEGVPVWIHFT